MTTGGAPTEREVVGCGVLAPDGHTICGEKGALCERCETIERLIQERDRFRSKYVEAEAERAMTASERDALRAGGALLEARAKEAEAQVGRLTAAEAVIEAARRSGYGGPHGHTWDYDIRACSRCAFAEALAAYDRLVQPPASPQGDAPILEEELDEK